MTTTWVERLVKEYNVEKGQLEKYRDKLIPALKSDKFDPVKTDEFDTVEEMIGDMNFALEWMRRGRNPKSKRGADRRNVYQRTALLDPELFPSLDVEPADHALSDEERRKIADILWALSKRERQCYLLHVSYGMSYTSIGEELKVSRTTVQTYVERARKKVLKK